MENIKGEVIIGKFNLPVLVKIKSTQGLKIGFDDNTSGQILKLRQMSDDLGAWVLIFGEFHKDFNYEEIDTQVRKDIVNHLVKSKYFTHEELKDYIEGKVSFKQFLKTKWNTYEIRKDVFHIFLEHTTKNITRLIAEECDRTGTDAFNSHHVPHVFSLYMVNEETDDDHFYSHLMLKEIREGRVFRLFDGGKIEYETVFVYEMYSGHHIWNKSFIQTVEVRVTNDRYLLKEWYNLNSLNEDQIKIINDIKEQLLDHAKRHMEVVRDI